MKTLSRHSTGIWLPVMTTQLVLPLKYIFGKCNDNKKILYGFIGFSLAIVSCNSVKIFESNSEKTYRDYVLYRCLESALGDKNVFSNDLSLGIYDELTNGTISDGKISYYLDSLVKNSIHPATVTGANHRKVIFMSCINYYNSKELHNDIKKVMKLKKEYDRNASETLKKAVGKKSLCLRNYLTRLLYT